MKICQLPLSFTIFIYLLSSTKVQAQTTRTVCLGYFLSFNCDQNSDVIEIQTIEYGVSPNNCTEPCCPGNCKQDASTVNYNAIITSCQGRSSCSYPTASTPPSELTTQCGNVKPYLLVKYTCGPVPTTRPTTTTTTITTAPPAVTTQRTVSSTQPRLITSPVITDGGQKKPPEGLPSGALIGIIVGIGCTVVLALAIIVFIILWRKRNQKPPASNFPPARSTLSNGGPIQPGSGHDEIYGFLPGAPVETDSKRASRTSAFIKEHKENADGTNANSTAKANGHASKAKQAEKTSKGPPPTYEGLNKKDAAKVKTDADYIKLEIKNEVKKNNKSKRNDKTGSTSMKTDEKGISEDKSKTDRKDTSEKSEQVASRLSENKENQPGSANKRRSKDHVIQKEVKPNVVQKEVKPNVVQTQKRNSSQKEAKPSNVQKEVKPSTVQKDVKPSDTHKDVKPKANNFESKKKESPLENDNNKDNKKLVNSKSSSVQGIINPAFTTEDNPEEDDDFKGTNID